ncbi:hypothetical protein KY363_06400 [Candidatus Woesearchaeota archaeon]|nr:hypothetical protein [Candidatus Woesearchaeota archaeon]
MLGIDRLDLEDMKTFSVKMPQSMLRNSFSGLYRGEQRPWEVDITTVMPEGSRTEYAVQLVLGFMGFRNTISRQWEKDKKKSLVRIHGSMLAEDTYRSDGVCTDSTTRTYRFEQVILATEKDLEEVLGFAEKVGKLKRKDSARPADYLFCIGQNRALSEQRYAVPEEQALEFLAGLEKKRVFNALIAQSEQTVSGADVKLHGSKHLELGYEIKCPEEHTVYKRTDGMMLWKPRQDTLEWLRASY